MVTRFSALGAALLLASALAGCAVATDEPSATSTPSAVKTIDPALIPTATPEALSEVDAQEFAQADGSYLFKVGTGPVWCSITPTDDNAVCEINEVDAVYEPVATPDTCDYSYGYQVMLHGTKPANGKGAEFLCAGGNYADPAGALELASNEKVTVGAISCFVADVTARCENGDGNFVVLGPKAYALGN